MVEHADCLLDMGLVVQRIGTKPGNPKNVIRESIAGLCFQRRLVVVRENAGSIGSPVFILVIRLGVKFKNRIVLVVRIRTFLRFALQRLTLFFPIHIACDRGSKVRVIGMSISRFVHIRIQYGDISGLLIRFTGAVIHSGIIHRRSNVAFMIVCYKNRDVLGIYIHPSEHLFDVVVPKRIDRFTHITNTSFL